MVKYFLMHKDDICGTIIFDEKMPVFNKLMVMITLALFKSS